MASPPSPPCAAAPGSLVDGGWLPQRLIAGGHPFVPSTALGPSRLTHCVFRLVSRYLRCHSSVAGTASAPPTTPATTIAPRAEPTASPSAPPAATPMPCATRRPVRATPYALP